MGAEASTTAEVSTEVDSAEVVDFTEAVEAAGIGELSFAYLVRLKPHLLSRGWGFFQVHVNHQASALPLVSLDYGRAGVGGL